jgi:hypothetical protein
MISVSGLKIGGEKFIRPTPLITISQQNNRTGSVRFGNSYKIILNGTIIAGRGNPRSNGVGVNEDPVWYTDSNYSQYNNNNGTWTHRGPPYNQPPPDKRLGSILTQQRGLRELFATDGLFLRVYHTHDTGANPSMSCHCVVDAINFEEGIWVDTCKYTVELTTYVIYHNQQGQADYPYRLPNDHPDAHASGLSPTNFNFLHGDSGYSTSSGYISGSYIEDFSEDWSVEEDDQFFNVDNSGFIKAPSYRVTRNLSATGRTAYFGNANIAGWLIAKDFVTNYLCSGQYNNLAPKDLMNFYVDPGNLGNGYFISSLTSGDYYNHTVSENFSVTEGTYSLAETFIVCSGGAGSGAMETYTIQVSSDHQNPFINVSINGSVQGLSTYSSRQGNPTRNFSAESGKYDMAIKHWGKISGSGMFGISSAIYKRANNTVGVALNSQPKSISIGLNKIQGKIDYALEFDNRPTNFISGVSYESVSINDTYPGDVFATIPVIGRKQGPIFQSMGTRTEYRRDVSLEFVLDYYDTFYPSGATNASKFAMLKKPILYDPYRTQIVNFISGVSPMSEPGIRKYFMNPTTETWSPKEGRYSLNLSWTYELDK